MYKKEKLWTIWKLKYFRQLQNALYIVDEQITEDQFRLISPVILLHVLKVKKLPLYGNNGANGAIIITTKKALEPNSSES
jgi:hypothetical protein